jgi:hypothetical protein
VPLLAIHHLQEYPIAGIDRTGSTETDAEDLPFVHRGFGDDRSDECDQVTCELCIRLPDDALLELFLEQQRPRQIAHPTLQHLPPDIDREDLELFVVDAQQDGLAARLHARVVLADFDDQSVLYQVVRDVGDGGLGQPGEESDVLAGNRMLLLDDTEDQRLVLNLDEFRVGSLQVAHPMAPPVFPPIN